MPAKNTTETDAASQVSSSDTSPESLLAWGTTEFEPGSDVGLVARQTIGLIERDNPSTRERLWGLVSDDAPLDDILDELSSTGLKALPDFGLAQVEGSAIRIVARGRTTISAELTAGSTHEIDPSGVRTWIEELVEDVAAITITLPGLDSDGVASSGEAFAVLAGSIPARSLSRRYDAAGDHADAAESGAGWIAGGTDVSSGSIDEPAPVSDVEEDLAPAPEVELEMVADIGEPAEAVALDSDGEESELTPGESWFGDQAGNAAAIIPPQPATEVGEAADPASAGPQPAVRLDITADPAPAGSVPFDPQPASPQPPPPTISRSGPPPSGPGAGGAPPEGSGALITGGPGNDSTVVVGPQDGPTRGPVSSIFDDDLDDRAAGAVTGALPGDHDGMTVGRSEIEDLQADAAHTAMPSNDAPVYGVLAFSNGERIDVDRAILIGRNPKVAGAVEGGLPHIMKFDGPGQGLSRTHAEVRVEGGEVLIEDLQSTNGTEVQLPGQQRRRLRGGEPVVIVPGTLIDFGDELHCTLESAS
jgi:hypothetical protein